MKVDVFTFSNSLYTYPGTLLNYRYLDWRHVKFILRLHDGIQTFKTGNLNGFKTARNF
jgi:hypothetical protein